MLSRVFAKQSMNGFYISGIQLVVLGRDSSWAFLSNGNIIIINVLVNFIYWRYFHTIYTAKFEHTFWKSRKKLIKRDERKP